MLEALWTGPQSVWMRASQVALAHFRTSRASAIAAISPSEVEFLPGSLRLHNTDPLATLNWTFIFAGCSRGAEIGRGEHSVDSRCRARKAAAVCGSPAQEQCLQCSPCGLRVPAGKNAALLHTCKV